jgi:hypothetical protein
MARSFAGEKTTANKFADGKQRFSALVAVRISGQRTGRFSLVTGVCCSMMIKLTEKRYVNSNAILEVEYTEAGQHGLHPWFHLTYLNKSHGSIDLKAAEADEAWTNWKASQSIE